MLLRIFWRERMDTTKAWEAAKAERRQAYQELRQAAARESEAKTRCIYALIGRFKPVINGRKEA